MTHFHNYCKRAGANDPVGHQTTRCAYRAAPVRERALAVFHRSGEQLARLTALLKYSRLTTSFTLVALKAMRTAGRNRQDASPC